MIQKYDRIIFVAHFVDQLHQSSPIQQKAGIRSSSLPFTTLDRKIMPFIDIFSISTQIFSNLTSLNINNDDAYPSASKSRSHSQSQFF